MAALEKKMCPSVCHKGTVEKVSPPPEDVARLFRALGGPKGTKEISCLARFSRSNRSSGSSRSSGMLCHAATIANPVGVTLLYLLSLMGSME